MAKKEAPVIKTARLTLRRLMEDDITGMSKMFSNENVTKYLTGDTPPYDEQSMLKIVRARRETEWAIILNETDEYIGDALIPSITEGYLGELGCVLIQDHWGKGYAKEVMLSLISYCKDVLELKRLCARIDENNTKSRNLFESLDFELNALLPEANFGGRVCNIAYYSRCI